MREASDEGYRWKVGVLWVVTYGILSIYLSSGLI